MVWEASQKGVPFPGVPGNSLKIGAEITAEWVQPGTGKSLQADLCVALYPLGRLTELMYPLIF